MTSSGKIALVTGGSRGLGQNMAFRLAEQGHDIVLTYQSRQADAEATVSKINEMGQKAVALQLNVGDVASFDTFFVQLRAALQDHWQTEHFHFLVNNAGIDRYAIIAEMTEEGFDDLINVHFKGVFFLTQKALPLLADGGRIVNISTGLTRFAVPGYAAYASAKTAIETFTKYLAKELGGRGITANVVAPGAIETDFTRPAFEHNPQIKGFLAQQTALGRVGQPDDIGGVVAFLCSEDAKWINAQRIEASGGMFL